MNDEQRDTLATVRAELDQITCIMEDVANASPAVQKCVNFDNLSDDIANHIYAIRRQLETL